MSEFERLACAVAREAGGLLAERFRHDAPLDVETKGLHDFVTEADRAAESLITSRIRERYPDHAITAEEGSPGAVSDGHCWIVDPLDGTTNFIHGVPVFAVSVAFQDRDGLSAGAIYDPLQDELFHASRGGGARLNGRPISCTRLDVMSEALLATGFPFRKLDRLDDYLETFAIFTRAAAGIRRAGSAVLDLAYTACGRYDGFWEVGLNAWDVAAGGLLVQEAGGRVTDTTGGPSFLDGNIVAAGPAIHARLVEVTREKLA